MVVVAALLWSRGPVGIVQGSQRLCAQPFDPCPGMAYETGKLLRAAGQVVRCLAQIVRHQRPPHRFGGRRVHRGQQVDVAPRLEAAIDGRDEQVDGVEAARQVALQQRLCPRQLRCDGVKGLVGRQWSAPTGAQA